jgi:hypothetical protein
MGVPVVSFDLQWGRIFVGDEQQLAKLLYERLAILFHYAREIEGRLTLTSRELTDWFGLCGFKAPARMDKALDNLKRQHHIVERTGPGQWALTAAGENVALDLLEPQPAAANRDSWSGISDVRRNLRAPQAAKARSQRTGRDGGPAISLPSHIRYRDSGIGKGGLYADRPYGLGTLYGYQTDKETGERDRFVISEPADLDANFVYAKERRLIEEIKGELSNQHNVQVFAVYTLKRDVTRTPARVTAQGRHSG